jgi:predicted  nucleic acid-binding Zn-ribbon protein
MSSCVPEQEVFDAADAVLARGERPTVERVRLEMGRGSPARVGALLDDWWKRLSARLRAETRLPGLPTEVAHAFVDIWKQATLMAEAVVEQGVSVQRTVLAEERERLAGLEEQARKDVALARTQTSEAQTARLSSETRLKDMQALLDQRHADLDDMRQQRTEYRAKLASAEQKLVDAAAQAETTRVEQERYTRDVEDRSHREVDRAREEIKAVGAQLQETLGKLQSIQKALQESQSALASSREQSAAAQARADTLEQQLIETRKAAAAPKSRAKRPPKSTSEQKRKD